MWVVSRLQRAQEGAVRYHIGLTVEECGVTDLGLELLATAKQLIELDLNGNDEITADGFKLALGQMRHIAVLKMKLDIV